MSVTDQVEPVRSALADRYAIEREIGRGGMATVYGARDLKHQRTVAVKVLLPELAATLGSDRFLQEIRVTANLQHPHILPLYDSGRAARRQDGREREFLYYVMPYVEGESLRDRLKREKQLSVDDALRLTEQIASALDYAHRQNVVHRDIKPENILLHEGVAMVADFGIALAVKQAGGERLTETGLSIGTPEYMSPEQVAGEREIDARSDVYSLACVLYELLAGQPPFTGATGQAILARHVTDPVPPITTVRPGVSAPVAAAIAKALGKAPADRFDSARLFADALRADTVDAEPETKSIVVLPFDNLSPDPENEYFADGLTEELITDLSQIRSLLVISRNSAMQLKNTSKDTKTIGRELGVRYVLEGTVRKAGNRLRITAQLIDSKTDAHLWANKFTGTLDDVFELQENVSRSIVDALQVELSPEEQRKIAEHPASGSVEAYDLYLLGRHHMNRMTEEGLRTAVDYFQRAVELQSDLAKAYTGLADSYMLLTQGSGEPPLENFPKARTATLRALEIDPLLEEAHTSLGGIHLFFDWDWDGAERELRRAIELNPNYGQAHHWLAISFNARGRHTEALEAMKRALALDPLSPYVNLNVGWIHYAARDFDSALAHLLHAIKNHPDSPGIRGVLGVVYAAKGMFDRAVVELEAAGAAAGQGFIMWLPMLGYTLARAGRSADAMKLLRDMEDMEQRRFVNPDYFTIIHIGLGEYDEALDRIEQATDARTDWPLWFSVDPMIDPIRTHPRFVALLERVGLSELAVRPTPTGTPVDPPLESAAYAGPRLATPGPTTEKSLAVLPLENLMGDPEQDYFVDGMAEALISTLAKAGSVRVIARASAMEYKGTQKPLPQIARELHVDVLAQGSVLRSAESVKIAVWLIEAASERQLWAENFERSVQDIIALQSDVAQAILGAIGTKLTSGERRRLAPARPVDPEAYDLYLKGRQSHFTWIEEGLTKAIRYFAEAIRRDPQWAPAHAGLADSYLFRCFNGQISPTDLLHKAKAAATSAVDLDETLGDGHAQLATISIIADYDWTRAQAGFARALELSPQSYSARSWHGIFYQLALGRHDAAFAEAKECLGLDPLNPAANLDLAFVEFLSRRYDNAIALLRALLEIDPNVPQALLYLGVALAQKSAFEEAIVAHEKAVLVSQRGLCFLAGLAHGYASAGRREEAVRILGELNVAWEESYAPPWFTAAAYVALRDHDTAFLWLDRAYEVRDPWLPFLRVEPIFDPLRNDQRYHDLVRRMNFPEEPSTTIASVSEGSPTPSSPQPFLSGEPKSIVVLPFENVSPDPENAFFTDGLTEELIADLSKVQALRVISRTSAFAFKGTTSTVPTIARELKVRYALEGSVRRAGNNLRITAQLIDTETDAHLWAEKYSGTLDDVFDLQEQLSRQIVRQLEVQLSTDEHRRLAARPLDDVQAHDIWLRARQSALALSTEGMSRAEQLVGEALALVGDNALLHATLGWIHMVRFPSVVEGAEELVKLASQHAAKAMELNPDLAWGHFVTGTVLHRRGQIQEAIDCFRRALAIERDSHVLSVMAIYLPELGRVAAARSYAKEVQARDPLSWISAVAAAYPDLFDGRAADVLDTLRTARERFAPNETWSTYELAYVATQAGREHEALELFTHAATSDSPLYSALGRLFAAALKGNRQDVVEVLSTPPTEQLARRFGSNCAAVASCLARVGEDTEAMNWLEAAIELGYTNHRFMGEHDRLLEPLRGEPRFQTLLERAREKERALII